MNIYVKRDIFLTLISVAILTGCGGGSTASTPTTSTDSTTAADSASITTASTQVTTAPAYKAMQEGEVKDSITGEPVANVEVSIGSQSTTTDSNGYYKLTNLQAKEKAVVTYKHSDYIKNSKIITIKEYTDGTTLSPNYLEVKLNKYDDQHSDNSENESLWSYYFGIKIPGGTYTFNKGDKYSGGTVAKVAYEDESTANGRDTFPGNYEGKNSNGVIVPFIAYGLMVIDLQNTNGISLSTTDEITLTFYTANGTSAESIPLWYYDYAKGLWIEEGEATRLPDGKYEGTVSHPGTWSLSQPIESEPGIYRDRIVYPDGTPVKNLRVYAIGKNWIKTDLTTDENGVFEIEVIPGEEFGLKVYHYGDKYGAEFNGKIAAVASGEIADKIK